MKIITMLFVLICTLSASAHFLTLLPSSDLLGADSDRTVHLEIQFTHPMEQGPLMNMDKPEQFGVLVNGKKENLLDSLEAERHGGSTAFSTEYKIRRPGNYIFYIEPAPYWEPAEQKMIVHYTKVVVDAFDYGDGWDQTVGFPVEIEPLTRPYGLWAGNVFQGIVKQHGEPVPFAEIEVEYWNDDGVEAPGGAFVTQVIKSDQNGVFSYAMPREGWWGFAALIDGPEKMKNPEGKEVDVELGALIWVHAVSMK